MLSIVRVFLVVTLGSLVSVAALAACASSQKPAIDPPLQQNDPCAESYPDREETRDGGEMRSWDRDPLCNAGMM